MKTSIYLKLQKKFGGQWVASSQDGKSQLPPLKVVA